MLLLPTGWECVTLRFTTGADLGHTDWFEQILAPEVLAPIWSKKLGVSEKKLAAEIALLTYAFPRGRVTKVGRKFRIHHGEDLTDAMKASRAMIEKTFGVTGKCTWLFDEHERCIRSDQAAMCELLRVSPSWKAV